MTQVEIIPAGSMLGFVPLTDNAEEWLAENIVSEDWQWLGNALYVDTRFADDLIEGLDEAGLL